MNWKSWTIVGVAGVIIFGGVFYLISLDRGGGGAGDAVAVESDEGASLEEPLFVEGENLYIHNNFDFYMAKPEYAELKLLVEDESNRLVVFAGGELSIEMRLEEWTGVALDAYSYLDLPISSRSELGGQGAVVFVSETGYCDGGGCTPPFVAYATLHRNDIYHLVFYGDTEISPVEERVRSAFSFLSAE